MSAYWAEADLAVEPPTLPSLTQNRLCGLAISVSHAIFFERSLYVIPIVASAREGRVRRREFITLLGGVAAAWPLSLRAQQRGRIPRIGVLLPTSADDTEYPALLDAFLQGLQQLGWTDGRNLQTDIRWSGGNADGISKNAVELAALAPDVIVAPGSATVGPLLQATRTIPIVFMVVPDPVGAGFVDSLARPGGNATGFTSFEYDIGGKWLELLKEIAPSVTRVAVVRDSAITAGIGQWGAI